MRESLLVVESLLHYTRGTLMLYKKHKKLVDILSRIVVIPFIWLPLVPIVFTDIILEIYHHICFPLCGISLVKRNNYIVFDRAQLSYITTIEKLSCLYCSYANGFFHYATAIGLETEKYWCGIKHKSFPGYIELVDHQGYIEYGDKKAYHDRYED